MPPNIDRRALLAGMTMLPATAAPLPGPGASGLGAAARQSGRCYGAAVRLAVIRQDRDFSAAIARECSCVTPELELKWATIEPRRGQLDFAALDDLADFARARGKAVHGHTLIWHRSIPPWAEQALGERRDWFILHRYFGSVIPRYGETITRWDVVNEPIDPQGPGGLRASPFLSAFGPDYVRRALESARIFAPQARLLINEYGLEYDDDEGRARRKAFLGLIDGLRAARAPLDGVGLQSHLDLAKGGLAQRSLRDFLHELAARGLTITLSELDVKEADYSRPAEQRDAAVASLTKSYLDAALDEPKVVGVTTWGLSDRYSWLRATSADLSRRPGARRDGSGLGVNRGLPLDAALQPKPMYQAMLAAFQAAGSKAGDGPVI